jgi:hypothetical protein
MTNEKTSLLGSDFEPPVVESDLPARELVIRDMTSAGTWTGKQLADTAWCTRYAALFYFNRSPWVERGYAGPVEDVRLIGPNDPIPQGVWVIELLDKSDQPGALGYHEGQARLSKEGASGVHSERGIALHPDTSEEIVVAKVFVKTSREDGAPVTEVLTHEAWEMLVDPYVNNESEIRVYLKPESEEEYIGEVGDPAQERPWDVGVPEGRPCKVPEALISDFAYPAWFGQPQQRTATTLCEEFDLAPRLEPFHLAPGGYMSVRKRGGEWTQIYGSDRPKAEANEHAFEGPDEA